MKPPTLWVTHRGTLTSNSNAPVPSPANLKRMLESIVVANWKDLMPDMDNGLIDVEYRLSPDRSLEYLRLWASSHWGFCDLICQYSMFWHWSTSKVVNFGAGYDSKSLAEALGDVLQHELDFQDISTTANGLIQVYPPTEEQRRAADQFIAAVQRRRPATAAHAD